MSQANKDFVRNLVEEVQNKHNLDAIDDFHSTDFVNRSAIAGFSPTRDGMREGMGRMLAAFPDLQATIHDQIAEDDKVVTRKTLHATHKGDLMGVPATGKRVSIEVIDIVRVKDNKAVEHWAVVDMLGLMQQIGAA